MPKVTVIVPVYGVEKYIERCARSLFEQTLDDVEFIFVDDCSPDRSIEILERILEEYPVRQLQTHIIRLPENGGLPHARKTGIEKATGEYIIHCDSDDWVDVTMYEKLYNKAIEEDADMVVCDFFEARNDGNMVQKEQHLLSLSSMDVLGQLLLQQLHGSCCNKLVRSVCYHENEIEYPTQNMHEDLVLTSQLIYYSTKIVKVEEPLYYYLKNGQSISNGAVDLKKSMDRLNQCVDNRKIIFRFLEREHLTEKYADAILLLKFSARVWIEPYLWEKKIHRLWCGVFPEVDGVILRNPRISIRVKLHFCVCRMMLYPIYYKIQYLLHKIWI